ncbi:glyoxylase-like metal-dependent hydrolase (beta-lactamase superfamily II) [Nocardioides cavernae]|uniref:Glyoxylase-like metal-dependent hydrolase (Beta-lactamase superfamily II) n=1 Tax=Nocardioides cavernae TaxID=1921566 RepID=A0A7Y9H4K7_9ACTN|nr:MBL fold metallo-hydrolase [Nocardioides cavernae]NYE37821.1 glyoxylase-like metal-dependent hydrolase (beta-lactamase superfamily II) [Nocardioides cavernae]
MPDFIEVAPRVWVAHYEWMHVNIVLVGGSDGLLMVDTHGSAAQARVVADDVRRLGAGPLTGLVNTHEHWDHHFGNATMVEEFGEMPVHATDWARDHVEESATRTFEHYAQIGDDPRREEVLATTLHLPTHTFSSAVQLDLGDRAVELIHPGRGHTAGDLVVRIPDADVLLGGDLVEESDPPSIGDDSFPLEWPTTLDLVLGLMTDRTVVVPGHGQVVDKAFVQDQRVDLGVIAETIRDLASRGVPQSEALAQGEWPWDPRLLESAVRRGYEHLPRSQRRLPLV